jgi:hypothetical protein
MELSPTVLAMVNQSEVACIIIPLDRKDCSGERPLDILPEYFDFFLKLLSKCVC